MMNQPQSDCTKIDEAVESIGWGRAQIRVIVLALGTWFCEALQTLSNAVFILCLAEVYGWSSLQRSSLVALTFLGIAIGCLVGGYASDYIGRRPMILASYMCDIVVAITQILAGPSYEIVAFLRVCMGFGVGLAMPSSLALASETCPEDKRFLMTSLRSVLHAFGQLAMLLAIALDDASYENTHWRELIGLTALPPCILLPFAMWLMPESPKLLARLGRWKDAYESLDILQKLNQSGTALEAPENTQDITDNYNTTEAAASKERYISIQRRLQLIFSPHMRLITFVLMASVMIFSGLKFQDSYVASLKVKEVADEGGSGLKPAWVSTVNASVAILLNVIVSTSTVFFARRSLLCSGVAVGIISLFLLVATLDLSDKEGIMVVVYYVGLNLPIVSENCGLTAIFQLSIDLYPVSIAGLSSAIIVTTSRLSSIAWPFIFEAIGGLKYWQNFYFLLIALFALITPIVYWVIPGNHLSLLTEKQVHEDENILIALPTSNSKV